MCFDSVAYKNVVSNGLVLDKNGQKMSKRLGNAVDPFETIETYGPDATRWYMMSNSQPWDNLKFDLEGIAEVKRKLFGTLYNTYQFFVLYANVDGFTYQEAEIAIEERPELDQWILSKLNSLIQLVDEAYESYEPTKAARAIQEFVGEELSNWFVRLSRRRFWKGDYSADKVSAYQTLYRCLETIAKLSAPIAPFYSDHLFRDLNQVGQKEAAISVHLSAFPTVRKEEINIDLEEKMEIAQQCSSMVLSLRKLNQIKVRQPLQKMLVPVLDDKFKRQLEDVKPLILAEVNVKELEFLTEDSGILVKRIKPNFKVLGPKYGKQMKAIAAAVSQMDAAAISELERNEQYALVIEGGSVALALEDVAITSDDIPGWLVATEGKYTVALDINLTDELKSEGIARELINRIQNLRKDSDLELTDRIELKIQQHDAINDAINRHKTYICTETLASSLELAEQVTGDGKVEVEVGEEVKTIIAIKRLN